MEEKKSVVVLPKVFSSPEEIVHQMTELDMLKSFRNQHLEKFVSSKIYAKLYAEMYAPEDTVIQIIKESGQPGIPGIERKFKAKEVQANEIRINEKERKILVVIDKLIKTEKNA